MVNITTEEDDMPAITTRSRKVPTAAEVSATDRWASDYIAENGIEMWRRMYTKGWTTKASDSYLEDHGLFDDQAFQAGYLDQYAGREKWHLSRCLDHDRCL